MTLPPSSKPSRRTAPDPSSRPSANGKARGWTRGQVRKQSGGALAWTAPDEPAAAGRGAGGQNPAPERGRTGSGSREAGERSGKPNPGVLRCGVCTAESRQPRTRPTAPEQAPDLDLRPSEPLRSTMGSWLQQCPHCGYAAPDISRAHPAVAQAVAAAPFRALVNDTAVPALARRFLAWAHVLEESGALHAAAEATLQAAWVADDQALPDLSRNWRLEAVALWRSGPPLSQEQLVRVVDALRRAGAWDDAGASCRSAQAGLAEASGSSDVPAAQVLALEARLIAAHDDGRHTLASALPPPARRPHITHQGPSGGSLPRRDAKPAGQGLLGRLRHWLGRS